MRYVTCDECGELVEITRTTLLNTELFICDDCAADYLIGPTEEITIKVERFAEGSDNWQIGEALNGGR